MRILSLFFLALAISVAGCSQQTTPEQEIEAHVEEMETALASLDNSGFMDHLALTFTGGQSGSGSMSRDDAQRMLAVYFLRYRKVRILVTQLDIEIDLYEPNLATSSATVALSGGEQLIPNSAGLYKVKGQWQNFEGDWKLTRLEWD